MSNLEEAYADWKKKNGIEDYTDLDKSGRFIFSAGWNARGNPFANVAGLLIGLAFCAYVITLLLKP